MGADLYTSRGHFRDPYNGWDVLWQFSLSWWNDISPLLDHDYLSVERTKQVLALLDERKDEFQDKMMECSAEDRNFFEKEAENLRDLLNEAVEAGER